MTSHHYQRKIEPRQHVGLTAQKIRRRLLGRFHRYACTQTDVRIRMLRARYRSYAINDV